MCAREDSGCLWLMDGFKPGECVKSAADSAANSLEGQYAVMLYNWLEKGIAPASGGFRDQSNWDAEAIEIVRNWVEQKRKK